jgi:hypothetical protein
MDIFAWSNGVKAVRSHKSDKINIIKSLESETLKNNAQQEHMQQEHAQQEHAQQEHMQQEHAQQEQNNITIPEKDINKEDIINTNVEERYEFKTNDMYGNGVPGDYCLNSTSHDFINNKREDSFSSTHSRYLVSRACGNPFLTHLNYVDDITKQAKFLIPKNSNMDS